MINFVGAVFLLYSMPANFYLDILAYAVCTRSVKSVLVMTNGTSPSSNGRLLGLTIGESLE